MQKIFRYFSHIMTVLVVTFIGAAALSFPAKAYDPYTAFSATEIERTHPESITMKPGQILEYTVTFKNVGTETWVNYGDRYVSAYTHNPVTLKYLNSEFRHDDWIDWNHPARIRENVVGPGDYATVTVKLEAPLVTGEYNEHYRLAVEEYIWMPGGRFSINIKVAGEIVAEIPPPSAVKPTPQPVQAVDSSGSTGQDPVTAPASGYKALMLIASARDLALQGGESTSFRLGFKNVGDRAWRKTGTQPVHLRLASGTADAIINSAWNGNVAAELPDDEVLPGQLAIFDVKLAAPQVSGSFTPKFEIVAGGAPVEGGSFELPVSITSNSSSAGTIGEHLYISDFANVGSRGPNVRLGLYHTTDPIVIASSGAYNLFDGNALVKRLSGVTTVQFDWTGKVYQVTNGGFSYVARTYPRLVPVDYSTNIFQITSYERRAAWDSRYNFNQFRGTLEARYSEATGRLWVIEELPMEDYIHGLAETSNSSHHEYQKALVTAARTYAQYVLYIGGKHRSEYHDLVTNGNDQVYKGYLSELLRPNVVRAGDETRGMVVTYDGELVVTPYFSRSDGRTRSWSEVWYGSKPWLVSRPAPYDAREGFELWGHGVGMSAMDAYYRAGDGWSWDNILKYYYSGVNINHVY